MRFGRRLLRLLPRRGQEDGVVMVLFALMLVVICLFAALAVDLGNIAQTKVNAQDAADDAALAGAALLPSYLQTGVANETQVIDAVEDSVQANDPSIVAGSSQWNSCTTVVPSGWTSPVTCIAFGTLNGADVMQVTVPPVNVNYTFGQVPPPGKSKGLTTQGVSAESWAAVPDASSCALCIMQPTGTTLDLASLFDTGITVTGTGGIAVDSDGTGTCSSGTPAADIGGFLYDQVTTQGGPIDVVGSWVDCALLGADVSPNPTTIAAPGVPDPLANLPVPPVSTYCTSSDEHSGTYTVSGSSPTLNPGCYNAITADSFTGNLTLNPGIYVITGHFDYSNAVGALNGTGVTLYFTCGTDSAPTACSSGGENGGYFSEDSGADLLNISPPTASTCTSIPATCPYVNLTFFYDRHDTEPLTLDSGLGLNFFGTVYAKSSAYDTNGLLGDTQDSLIVVGLLGLGGDEFLNVDYNASQNVPTGQAENCYYVSGTGATNC